MIQDLDAFVQWIENERSMGRIEADEAEKVLAAIDIVETAIEEWGY